MKYTPKHKDNIMRAIYGALVVLSFAFMSFGTGIVRTMLVSLAVLFLGVGMYLFIRYEMTTFSYLALGGDGRYDFYVDRAVGKRGAYVCYYPLVDYIYFGKYEKGVKKKIKQEHGKTFFYNYCHNRFNGEKYIIAFQNHKHCDAMVIELDGENKAILDGYIEECRATKENIQDN